MSLTEPQLEAIATMIDALNVEVSAICDVRDQIEGLTDELHEGFSNNNELMAVVGVAKARAKASADTLSALLT